VAEEKQVSTVASQGEVKHPSVLLEERSLFWKEDWVRSEIELLGVYVGIGKIGVYCEIGDQGCCMAGLATHASAEPDTLVVRFGCEEREWLMADAPETYYPTDYYRSYPLLLARLSRVDRDALHDLLSVSWRLTSLKSPTRRRSRRNVESARTPSPFDAGRL
jgi:hypothetical protein